MKLVEMVKQSPGATGVGAIAGAIATIAVAFITPLMTGHNFERNLAIEAMKGAKTAEDVTARLDLL